LQLGADFVLEVQLLLGKLVLQFLNLAVCDRVFDRDGDLVGYSLEKSDLFIGERALLVAAEG